MGDIAAAREDVNQLSAIRQSLSEIKGDYDWAGQVEIERQIAFAWLTHAEGNHEEAVKIMRAVAELDDMTEKHPVTPGSILPAREQLGELLLELKQPDKALVEFETSLRSAPNRFNGLLGAARSAKLASNERKARSYYQKLATLRQKSPNTRAEIDEAKSYLAGQSPSDR
jgi:tetratricopeptide (TPR) repeat protein